MPSHSTRLLNPGMARRPSLLTSGWGDAPPGPQLIPLVRQSWKGPCLSCAWPQALDEGGRHVELKDERQSRGPRTWKRLVFVEGAAQGCSSEGDAPASPPAPPARGAGTASLPPQQKDPELPTGRPSFAPRECGPQQETQTVKKHVCKCCRGPVVALPGLKARRGPLEEGHRVLPCLQ